MHPHWPAYLRILLAIHIAFGGIAFVCAPVALATAKGGRAHRRWGKVYFWCMAGVAATALILSVLLPIPFLLMVAVFSFYSAFAAYRILYLKDLYRGGKPQAMDWVAAVVTIVSSLVLFVLGFTQPHLMRVGVVVIGGREISIVSMVFGLIGLRMGVGSIRLFTRKPEEKMFWWYSHMQGMMGSYIAAMTAFSAVNFGRFFGPAWWVWLWPSMVGIPAIAIWTRYYKRKFTRKPMAAARVPISGEA